MWGHPALGSVLPWGWPVELAGALYSSGGGTLGASEPDAPTDATCTAVALPASVNVWMAVTSSRGRIQLVFDSRVCA